MQKNVLSGYENVISFPDRIYDAVNEGDVLEVKLLRCTPTGVEERTGFTAVLYKAEVYNDGGKLHRYVGFSPVVAKIVDLAMQYGTVYDGSRWIEFSDGEKEPWTVSFPAIAHWHAAEDLVVKYKREIEFYKKMSELSFAAIF